MAIEELKIVPAAFAPIGAKVNECVDALGELSHLRNLDVESPLKLIIAREGTKLVIDIKKLVDDINASPGGGTGGGGSNRVANVLHYNDGTVAVDIDASGVTVTRLSNGKYISLDPTTITQNMSPTEWAVNNSGSPGTALFLSSAPY